MSHYPGFPKVEGRCPCCGWRSLFLGAGGFVTCANLDCSNPCQASELLGALERPLVGAAEHLEGGDE